MFRAAASLIVGLLLGTWVVSSQAAQPCETPTPVQSDVGTSRSNPVALGEWATHNRGDVLGQFRVLSAQVVNDVTGFRLDMSEPQTGETFLAVVVEYACESVDTTCDLGEFVSGSNRVTNEGRVQEWVGSSNILHSTSVIGEFDDTNDEVYGGLTLRAVVFFDIGADETFGLLRLNGYYMDEYLFFSLNASD